MIRTKVIKKGPLFDGRARAAARAFLDVAVEDVADAGRDMARTIAPKQSGYFASRITVDRAGRDRVVSDGGVVYGPWLEGTSSRNQSTRFKGYRIFRQTGQRLQARVPAIVQPALKRFIARMQ